MKNGVSRSRGRLTKISLSADPAHWLKNSLRLLFTAMRKRLSLYCCPLDPKKEALYARISGSLDCLAESGNCLHYRKGQVIFYEGHHPCGFYFLKKGKISFLAESTPKGDKRPCRPHDRLLGLAHLISDTPYCATCTAAEDVDIFFVPKSAVTHDLEREMENADAD